MATKLRTPPPDALRLAADWLSAYDGDSSETLAQAREVQAWLEALAGRRDLELAARAAVNQQASGMPSAARAKIARRLARRLQHERTQRNGERPEIDRRHGLAQPAHLEEKPMDPHAKPIPAAAAGLVSAEGHDLEPGQQVHVLGWDDLVAAYGLDQDGDIDCPGSMSFTRAMRAFCGATGVLVAMGAAASPDFRDGCTSDRLEELAAGQPIRLVFDDARVAALHARMGCQFTAWMVQASSRSSDSSQKG